MVIFNFEHWILEHGKWIHEKKNKKQSETH